MESRFTKNYCFKLDGKGLCSELNGLVAFYSFVDKDSSIYVDTESSPYFGSVPIHCIFNRFEPFKKNNAELEMSASYAKYASKRYKLNLSKNECADFFKYTHSFNEMITNKIKNLNLPKTFDCLHIRRGDKVGEAPFQKKQQNPHKEAERKEVVEYLCKTENDFIFVMTDDFAVIDEIKRESNKKIYYIVEPEQRGNSTIDNRRKNKTHTEEELLIFFTEIEIAKMCNIFVGTKTSNIFRYIQNQCTNDVKFVSID